MNVIELAQDGMVAPETSVTRTITSLHDLGLTVGKRVAVTLVSAEAAPAAVTTAVIDVPTVKAAPVVVPKTPDLDAIPEQAEAAQARLSQSRDIRQVASTKVNMRSGPG
ncbi:MAG: SH3 domain-containing protein, partial [Roseovarius sp.]|nr:SH3 domain-containing protein [Roseovarius sp.]